MATPWKVRGTYFESCTCEAACPCVFMSPPTEGKCSALLGWNIEEGNFGDTRLDKLRVALFAHAPGHMLQTKWRVALYLDERADKSQQEALAQIFSGQAGGHLAALSPLIGEVMGMRPVTIDYREEGKKRSLRIGGVAEMEIEALVGQGEQDITLNNVPFTAVPGFPAVVARSKRLKYRDHGIDLEISQRNGFYSPFAYQP